MPERCFQVAHGRTRYVTAYDTHTHVNSRICNCTYNSSIYQYNNGSQRPCAIITIRLKLESLNLLLIISEFHYCLPCAHGNFADGALTQLSLSGAPVGTFICSRLAVNHILIWQIHARTPNTQLHTARSYLYTSTQIVKIPNGYFPTRSEHLFSAAWRTCRKLCTNTTITVTGDPHSGAYRVCPCILWIKLWRTPSTHTHTYIPTILRSPARTHAASWEYIVATVDLSAHRQSLKSI